MALTTFRRGVFALLAVLVASCSKLDLSGADRCQSQADCLFGRVCHEGRCLPPGEIEVGDRPARRAMDAGARTDAAAAADRSDAGKRGTGDMDAAAERDEGGAPTGEPVTTNAADRRTPDDDAAASGNAQPPRDDDDEDEVHDEDPDEADAGPLPPLDCEDEQALLEGVSLWLDAASGVGADSQGRVREWFDRSRYRHIARSIYAETALPLLLSDVDGFPAVSFGAAPDTPAIRRLMVRDHPSLQFGTTPFALIAVLRHRTPTTVVPEPELARGAIFVKICECESWVGPGLFANDLWPWHIDEQPARSSFVFELAGRTDFSTQPSVTGFNDNRLHVVVASRIESVLSVHVDGMLHAELFTSPLDVSTPGVPVTIGAHSVAPVHALEGEIFELLALTGDAALRARERGTCLLRKYGKQ